MKTIFLLLLLILLPGCAIFDAPAPTDISNVREADYWIPDFISRSYPDYKTLPTKYVDKLPVECDDGAYGCVVITPKSINTAVCQPYVRSYLTGEQRECVRYHEEVGHCVKKQRHPPNHPPTLGMYCGNGKVMYDRHS